MKTNNVIIKSEKAIDWEKAKNYIPELNTICIYEYDNASPKIKIGNGKNYIKDLPFVRTDNSPIVDNGILNFQ